MCSKPKWTKAGQDDIKLNWKINWKSKDESKVKIYKGHIGRIQYNSPRRTNKIC